MKRGKQIVTILTIGLLSFACRREVEQTPPTGTAAGAAPPTNRVDVPEAVRRNLGITFARVESRPVSQMLRVPGVFEFLPDARREYRTMLAGRVELLVKQYQQVKEGAPLYRLDSPPWRELQQRLSESETEIREAETRVRMMGPLLKAHQQHQQSIKEQVRVLSEQAGRLQKGAESGSVSSGELAQAQAALAEANTRYAQVQEKEAELEVSRAEATAKHEAARNRFDLLLDSAATVMDLPKSKLTQPESSEGGQPLWRTREHVEIAAAVEGYVESLSLTNGSWAEETSLVLSTVQPQRIRFHAHGMQSDLGRLREGLAARIVPPRGGTIDLQDTMEGVLTLGVSADPQQRTIDLYVVPERISGWARPGVSAHLEVTLSESTGELAIPTGAVIQDGLKRIIFRRDPKDPDKVIRMDADLGVSDGRWVVVQSGVGEGDEVVLDGNYQLMLATSVTSAKGGHFHPDGTWHEGNE